MSGASKGPRSKAPSSSRIAGAPPTYCYPSIACRTLLAKQPSIVDLLAQPDAGDIDFEPVRVGGSLFRPADLA